MAGKRKKQRARAAAQTGEDAPIAQNRRARYEYEILDTHEAGLVLLGMEVKSLRAGRVNLAGSFAALRRGELFLLALHITPWESAGAAARAPQAATRPRKLLLHRRELAKLSGQVAEKGLTLIPLSLYWKRGRAKVLLALARRRRRYDKRAALRRKDQQRTIARALRRPR